MKKEIYFAYGSNLNKIQMQKRCPDSELISECYLPGYELTFRGVADVIVKKAGKFPEQFIWYPKKTKKPWTAMKDFPICI